MSNYRTPDEVASLLFDDNQEDSSTSKRLDDDNDCSDYVSSDDDNEEYIILSDLEYNSEDNNDNAEASDASGRYITNTSTALFTLKSGVQSWAAEPLLPLTFKTSQRNIIREKPGVTRYAIRMSGSLGDCFSLFFRDNLLEEICRWTNKEGQGVFSNNWKDTTVAELRKVIRTLLLVGVYKSSNKDLSQLWHMEHGRPIFCKIISRNHFQHELRVLRFDDAAVRRSARSPDKFSPIRNVFEIWNKSFGCICSWTQSDDRRATCDISESLSIPPVYAIKTRKIWHQDLGYMRLSITLHTEIGCVQRKRNR